MKVQYACIIFNLPFPFPSLSKTFNFDDSTKLFQKSIKEQIENPDSNHWSEWLGSITWNFLCQSQLYLSTWQISDEVNLVNSLDTNLQSKISNIFKALPLIAPLAPPDHIFMLSGNGLIKDNKLIINNILTFSQIEPWLPSFFISTHWTEYYEWAKIKINTPNLLEDWKITYEHIYKTCIANKDHRQIVESLRSFEESMGATQLEFKIPNLVRSIECLVDCWGFQEFADRTILLGGIPPMDTPFEISINTNGLLKALYQIRNDCSHGKIFAYSLEKKLKKPPTKNTIARFEFLAEWYARRILVGSFSNSSILEVTSERDHLNDTWKRNKIQPHSF